MSKLCERLRQLRAECHMTQVEVAEQLHMTRQAVSSYESGRTEPDLETLKQLAEIYGVTLEELLGTEEAGGKSVRRSLWILRGTNGVILLCSLVRSALLWIADRFYPVESGMVTPEMAAPIVDIATSNQLLLRLPEKKPALSALRPAKYEIKNSSAK